MIVKKNQIFYVFRKNNVFLNQKVHFFENLNILLHERSLFNLKMPQAIICFYAQIIIQHEKLNKIMDLVFLLNLNIPLIKALKEKNLQDLLK